MDGSNGGILTGRLAKTPGRQPRWISVSLDKGHLPVIRSGDKARGRAMHRLHLFSLDLSTDGLERAGGVGISIPCLPIGIEVRKAPLGTCNDSVPDEISDVASVTLNRIREALGTSNRYEVSMPTPVYRHMGLGSTTQVAALVAGAAAALLDVQLSFEDLSALEILDAGSCVGLTLLSFPGVIVDLGFEVTPTREDASYVPHLRVPGHFRKPQGVALQLQEPPPWWIILVLTDGIGLSGQEELDFWSERLPTGQAPAHECAYRTLMDFIPAFVCRDLQRVRNSLSAVSQAHTKIDEIRAQGSATQEALSVVETKFGFAGLSSLGPCVYTVTDRPVSIGEFSALVDALPPRSRVWQFQLGSEIRHEIDA